MELVFCSGLSSLSCKSACDTLAPLGFRVIHTRNSDTATMLTATLTSRVSLRVPVLHSLGVGRMLASELLAKMGSGTDQMSTRRIVSLIASATEIVCALGFEDQLVGRSHECDYPQSVKRLPQLTSPKFNVEGTSAEIDSRVKSVLQDALSVYHVDPRMLEDLKPTHIITQSQCEVCAVSLKDVERAVCELTSMRPAIVSLKPDSLADVWEDIN